MSPTIWSTVFVAFASALVACGPAESSKSTINNGVNNGGNNGNNGGAGSVTEILPDGYERVSAARFNPDGSRLAMVATPDDESDDQLITTDLTGGDVEVLASSGLSYLTTIAWMPDGESLVYGGDGGILEVGTDGGSPAVLVDAFAVESVDVSPDGAYVTWSINGGTSITTAPLSAAPTATDEHIAGPEGDMPRFSTTGERIAYISADGVAVSATNGNDAQSFEASTTYLSNVAWRDANTIVALTEFGVTSFNVASDESTDIYEQFAAVGLDVSPDGSMYVLGVNGQPALQLGSF